MLSSVDEIKNKLDVVEVVSGYIKLQKTGRNFRAICPFHSEKTPSFFVSPERQIWHCFGCGKGGDIFTFVKEIEGLEFYDTLKILAQRAGVALKRQDPKLKSEKQRLYEICELAAKFFEKQLAAAKAGSEIKKYLDKRGIGAESISQWRLGFAPDDWHALSKFLKSKGYSDSEIIKSGVVVEKDGVAEQSSAPTRSSSLRYSTYYDRFRNRIIFPIFDLNGQIVGFAGRVAPGQSEESAKYINTPQTLIYDKGRILYGLDKAKLEIRTKNYCVIVEGNTDVIMSQQAGIKNTAASSGTALTADHLKIIKRYTENIILSFDLDLAGDVATKRTIDLAINQGFNVKIIHLMDSGKGKIDPADIIRKNPKDWIRAIEKSQGIVEFYFANLFSRHNPKEVSGKKAIAKEILPLLKKIPNKIEQAHWLQELSKQLSVQEKFLIEAIKEIKAVEAQPAGRSSDHRISSRPSKTRREALEEELVALILGTADIRKQIIDLEASVKYAGLEKLFFNGELREIMLNLQLYAKRRKKQDEIDFQKWQKHLPANLSARVSQIIFQLEVKQPDLENQQQQIEYCIDELKKENIKTNLVALQGKIIDAEKLGNKEKLEGLLKNFKKLAKDLVKIGRI